MPKKILILYTELAGYVLACLRETGSHDVEVHLVRYKVNKEAPFTIDIPSWIHTYKREDYTKKELIDLARQINPDLILCSGWIDRDYVTVCSKLSRRSVTVMTMDNKWEGTMRQKLATLLSRFTIRRIFRYVWVPGEAQKKYALRLGFNEDKVRTGFYSADTKEFSGVFDESHSRPHRFIYAGRYYEFKGVRELWLAFERLRKETNTEWELWCVGTGDISPPRVEGMRHFGFVQPREMKKLIMQSSVFILPSRQEPWGVVVHEFAAAGFPLLLSDKVGAAEKFLVENENGFMFRAGNVDSIYAAMRKMIMLPDEVIRNMGNKSHQLAMQLTPELWVKTLMSFIDPAGNQCAE